MNVILIIKNVTWIKSGIAKSVGVSIKIQKNILCAKNVIFGILQYVATKVVNMQEGLVAQ